jgi:hypothetical protein
LGQVGIFIDKTPWLGIFELQGITITPNLVPLGCITICHHVFPMKLETMLFKLIIVILIIKNIKMIFNETL